LERFEKYIPNLKSENLKGIDHLGDLVVDGRKILRRVLKE
jgi:hypothetical protein